MPIRPRRSVLYMPGSNARALEKAKSLPADALILDLEDAVAPEAKEAARSQVCAAVKAGGYGGREIVIRINGLETPWGRADLEAAAAAAPDAVLVPKVGSGADIASATDGLAGRRAGQDAAVGHDRDAAGDPQHRRHRGRGQRRRARGSPASSWAPTTSSRRPAPTSSRNRRPALYWLSAAVTAARAYGLDVLDGVYNNFKDAEGFRRECVHGRALGFDGKTLIHPDQIAAANEVFAPPEAEVAWARKIIAAFGLAENKGKGVITVEGRMVELMHAEMARRTVAIADAITGKGP